MKLIDKIQLIIQEERNYRSDMLFISNQDKDENILSFEEFHERFPNVPKDTFERWNSGFTTAKNNLLTQ